MKVALLFCLLFCFLFLLFVVFFLLLLFSFVCFFFEGFMALNKTHSLVCTDVIGTDYMANFSPG